MDGANPSGDLSGKSLSSNRQQPDAKALEHFPGFEKQGLDGSTLPDDVRMIYTKEEFEALKERRGIAELENQSNEAWKKNNKKWLYWMRKGYREDEADAIRQRMELQDLLAWGIKQQAILERLDPAQNDFPEHLTAGNAPVPHGHNADGSHHDSVSRSMATAYPSLLALGGISILAAIETGSIFMPGPDDLIIGLAASKGYKIINGILKMGKGERQVAVLLSKEGKLLTRSELEALRAEAKGVKSKAPRSGSTAATNAGRPFRDRIADFNRDPSRWETISSHTEQATRRGARQGGVSVQTQYRNRETGETLWRHQVIDDRGRVVDDHFRPFYKPRAGDLNEP